MQGHVVVIDRSLPHTAALLAALPDQARVIWIDPRDDGLSRLAASLEASARPCEVLHLLSHGAPGMIHLGASVIDNARLASDAASLARIAARLGDDAEVRVYGCEVAAGATGAAFVDALAHALGATVSAATRVIGLTAAGPWWQLDAASGSRRGAPTSVLVFDAYPATLPLVPGTPGADILTSAPGIDTLVGGLGNDTYVVDDSGDIVTELLNEGTDQVNSLAGAYTLGANVENGRILAAGLSNLTGNSLANVLYAGAGDNVIDGGAGTDAVSYVFATGGVTVSLALLGAQVTVGSGSDTLIGIENLIGSNFADTLTGNAAANSINGGAGADLMTGGDGSDTYDVDNLGDVVTETNALAAGGTDLVNSRLVAYTLGANIENGRILSAVGANLTGNTLANTLYVGIGNNVIDGGAGLDTASYAFATGAVTVSLATPGVAQLTVGSGSDTLIGIENLTGSNFTDTLTGDAAANAINGGLLADTMIGGDGSDTYTVDNVGDVVTETNALAAGGTDQVSSLLAAYTLGANVENGRILSAVGGNLTGNTLANTLIAGAGANVLDGGAGLDTASYAVATAAVTVSLAVVGAQVTGGSGSDTLVSIENLTGSNFADTLTGNAAANAISGGVGADTMTGGDGADTYDVDNLGDVVTETNALAAGGTDLVNSRLAAYTLGANVENGRILSTAAANLTGNALANTLFAAAGNNVLDGGAGLDTASYAFATVAVSVTLATPGVAQLTVGSGSDTLIGIENLTGSNFADTLTGNAAANVLTGGVGIDTLVGGDGSDTYDVDNAGDVVTETNALAAGGIDLVNSRLVAYTLGANVEQGRILSTVAANLTGNTLANTLYAGAGNNVIDGGAGLDTASYAFAAAAVNVTLATPGVAQVTGGSGSDTLIGIENLTGSNFADTLTGDATANAISGGLGADLMTGGDGSDIYTVDNIGDVIVETNALAAGGIDRVNASVAYTLSANVENLTLTGAGNINGTGNALNNVLIGNAGINVLDGGLGNDSITGTGNDTLIGGAGDDSYFVTSPLNLDVIELAGGGIDTVFISDAVNIDISGVDNFVENIVMQGVVAGNVLANDLNNTITGNVANNRIDGAGGNDSLIGGAGDDSLLGGAGADTLVGGVGNDTLDGGVIADTLLNNDSNTLNYSTSTASVEAILDASLIQTADGSGRVIDGLGGTDNVLNMNAIVGSASSDGFIGSTNGYLEIFEGGLGNDYIDGGAIVTNGVTGNNRASYLGASNSVTVNLASGTSSGAAGNDLLRNINQVRGSNFADTLIGSDNSSAYTEQFEGRGGNDAINGGGGIDLVRYDNATSGVTVNLATGSGASTVGTAEGTDTLLNIEGIRGSAFADVLTGGAIANGSGATDGFEFFIGNAGNDTINGGAGYDRVDYTTSRIGVSVILSWNGTGSAFDGVPGSGGVIGTDSLIDIEAVRGSAFNDALTGSDTSAALNGENFESFEGREGDDLIDGGGGIDRADYANDRGSVFVNLLTGVGFDGSGGIDTLTAIEVVRGSDFDDDLTGSTAADTLQGGGGDDHIVGDAGNDSLVGGDGLDFLVGGLGNDTLLGGASSNVLVGDGNGLEGGAGNDLLDGSGGISYAIYDNAAAAVDANLATGSAQDGDGGTDTLIAIRGIAGSAFNDRLTGNALDNDFAGRAGNDTIDGGAGIDTVFYDDDTIATAVSVNLATGIATGVGHGTDTLIGIESAYGSIAADTLTGSAGANRLNGSNGNDTIAGGDGNDTLDGGSGADVLDGGVGIDTVDYSEVFSGVAVNLGSGATGNDGLGSSDSVLNVEAVIGSAFNDNLVGSAVANTLTGGQGNDVLNGGAGNDSLVGGEGSDTLIGGAGNDNLDGGVITDLINLVDLNFASFASGAVTGADINLQTNIAADGQGGSDTLLNINFVLGTGFADVITGSSRNIFEQIEGGAGNDTLDGGAINLLQTNSNRLSYINTTGSVVVDLLAGTATDGQGGSDSLSNFNSVRGGNFNDTLLGSNSTTLTEQFEGRAGNNTIDGRAGIDIVRYDIASSGVNVNLATGEGHAAFFVNGILTATTDTLLNIEGIRGSAFADVLTGGNAANGSGLLDGFEVFVGMGGGDTIDGGAGYDRVDYTSSTSGVLVRLNQAGDGVGFDRLPSGNGVTDNDVLIDIEAVRGSAFDDILIGSDTSAAVESGNNFESFEGRQGNDLIDGAGGYDRADYANSEAAVTVNLATGVALDGHGDTDTLVNIEAVRGSLFDDRLTGSTTAAFATTGLFESFEGNAGNDTIDGGAGMDRVDYQGSDAAVNVNLTTGTANDGLGGTDTLLNIEAVRGGDFNDVIIGSALDNRLNGNLGNDTLSGGLGADVFTFDTALNGATNVDTITDFTVADLISLDNDVFTALGGPAALGAAQFFSGAGLTGSTSAAQGAGIYYDSGTGSLYYDPDGFGGAAAIKFAALTGAPSVSAGNFEVRE